jgi:threonylcarbamoyladenosine tRNA methylthiotransferase MtaB
MRVAFYTLGCKVNQYESAAMAETFASSGAELVSFTEEADIYVVNTCTVTAKASYQSRQILRRIKRVSQTARVIATGCYVQAAPQEVIDAVPGRVCLVGNDQKGRLVDLALREQVCLGLEIYVGDMARVTSIAPFLLKKPVERTRAFVRVQDGCNAFCSYCVVPYTRGRSRSLAPDLVHEQVRTVEEKGVKEVVLSGIHVGRYGQDLQTPLSLFELLQGLCRSFPLMRFRLSSIEPNELTPEIISWARSTENFCPHWHIPLQSGADAVLGRMNRRYTASSYRHLIRQIRAAMPDAAIGADVMTGFPGENEKEFTETLSLLENLPITYVHAFPFSPRPGTAAGAMPNFVPKQEKARRVKAVISVGKRKRQAFYERHIGKTADCLVEQRDRKRGMWRGLTRNYITVFIEDGARLEGLQNRILPLTVFRVEDGMVFGRIRR